MAYDPRSGRLERIANRRGLTDDSGGGGGSSSDPGFDPRPPSRADRSPDDDRDQTDPGSRQPSGGSSDAPTETVSGSATVDPRSGRLERIAIDRGLVEPVESGGGSVDFSPQRGRLERIATGTTSFRTNPTERVEAADDDLGTIADARIPGTDMDVLGALDQGDRAFQRRVVAPVGDTFERAGEADLPVGPAGGIEGSEQRGRVFEDFGRSAAQSLNVPGFAGDILRAPRIIQEVEGDPERARELGEAGVDAGREGVEFAQENPVRAGAMAGGAFAGAGVATGASRGVLGLRGSRSSSLDDIVDDVEAPRPRPGTGGVDSILDPSDIRQPASNPTGAATTGGRLRRELDDFLSDDRGQLQVGRQRPRDPDGDSGTGGAGPSSDDLLEGSPRDRISDDITGRQRAGLDSAQGTFDGAGDPIMARPPDRGTSVGSRIPRDPLDSSGGRAPTGGSVGRAEFGVGGAAGSQGLFGGLDVGDSDLDGATDFTGVDDANAADTGTGSDTDLDVGTGTDTDTDTDPFAGTDEDVAGLTRFEARSTVAPRSDVDTFVDSLTAFDTASPFDDPTPADPTRTGTGVTRPPQRPTRRRLPSFEFEFDRGRDEVEADFAAAEAVFENPTQSLGDVSDDLRSLDRITEGFDGP